MRQHRTRTTLLGAASAVVLALGLSSAKAGPLMPDFDESIVAQPAVATDGAVPLIFVAQAKAGASANANSEAGGSASANAGATASSDGNATASGDAAASGNASAAADASANSSGGDDSSTGDDA